MSARIPNTRSRRRYLLWGAGLLVVGALLGPFVWPSLSTYLIERRIKKQIAGDNGPPGTLSFAVAISTSDPPERVFDVLWKLATSEKSTAREGAAGTMGLGMFAAGDWIRPSAKYPEEVWRKAFDDLLKVKKRQHGHSSEVQQFLSELETAWSNRQSNGEVPAEFPAVKSG